MRGKTYKIAVASTPVLLRNRWRDGRSTTAPSPTTAAGNSFVEGAFTSHGTLAVVVRRGRSLTSNSGIGPWAVRFPSAGLLVFGGGAGRTINTANVTVCLDRDRRRQCRRRRSRLGNDLTYAGAFSFGQPVRHAAVERQDADALGASNSLIGNRVNGAGNCASPVRRRSAAISASAIPIPARCR